jgi:HEAT repeat protein
VDRSYAFSLTLQTLEFFMKYLSFSIVAIIFAGAAGAADKISISAQVEAEQLAILKADSPAAQKALACKRLAIDGSSSAVPELAKLLGDPQLSSWARIALEAIPGPEADAALRDAAEKLDGLLLVGMLNSLGVRRDAQAVELLGKRLTHPDNEVVAAAAVALGRVGNTAAAQALRAQLANASPKVRSAVAEGCVLCAERWLKEGKSTEAAKLYDEIRLAEVPKQRQVEATRGAILARGEQGLPLLLEHLRGNDKQFFQLALGTAREFPGTQIDKALAAELSTLSESKAAAVVSAMADRPASVELSTITAAAVKGPKLVRLAALNALIKVGNDSCVDTLLNTIFEADADLSAAARATLADLPGKTIDAKIVAQLASADAKRLPQLFAIVGQRRIPAVETLVKGLDHSDAAVRTSAITALGETVELSQLHLLVQRVVAPKQAEDAAASQTALKAASVRMPDRDACASELAKALTTAPVDVKIFVLEILGEVGGEKALATLATAAKSEQAELQDAGSRVLGKWNGIEAAPVLLDLAKNGPASQYRSRALRGYLGIARKFAMPDEQRAAMCRSALDLSKQAAEQKLVLEVLKLHPNPATLAVAIQAMDVNGLKDEASQTVMVMAQKMKTKGPEVIALLSKAGFQKVKLEIVKAEYGAGTALKDVTSILQKQVGELPLVSLLGNSYNASFGGDPAPNATKTLKIQYRVNGKPAEATFAEDAVILLPLP